jgi:hypothetical protein
MMERGSGRSKDERGRVDAEEEVLEVENAEKLRARRKEGLERRDVWTSLDSIIFVVEMVWGLREVAVALLDDLNGWNYYLRMFDFDVLSVNR